MCQFDPARLREPAELSQPLQGSGFGLPAFLARLALNYKEARDSLQNAFRRRFPFYTDYKTVPGKENGRDVLRLEFSTVQQRSLPSESVSDGVMVSLGFLALAHDPEPPAILLVEEPENGVHHASLKDIVQTLRDLTATGRVQVILTTHSPYLLDYAQPNEVHVFTKDEQGAVHARKLADFEGTDEIGDMFGTGEKWTMLSEKHGI